MNSNLNIPGVEIKGRQRRIDAVLDIIIENGFKVNELHRMRLDQLNGIPPTLINHEVIIQWIEESLEGVEFVSNRKAIFMNSNRIGGFGFLKPVPNWGCYSLSISSDLLSVIQRNHRLGSTTLTKVIKKWMWDCHGLKIMTVTKLYYNH